MKESIQQSIIDYWMKEYQRTHFPFIPKLAIEKHFGFNVNDILRQMLKEGVIKVSRGLNDFLITYTGDPELTKEFQNLLS